MKIQNTTLMRFLLIFCFSSIFFLACEEDPTGTGNDPGMNDPGMEEPVDSNAWDMVFEEDFNGDLSRWELWNGGAFNNEIQMYTPQRVATKDGILTISTQRQDVTGPTTPYDPAPKEFEYVSARIESKELFGPTTMEGNTEIRMIARIKLPSGHGMWPAFWSFGDPWPTQGEIDILEARGGEPDRFQSNLFYGEDVNININTGNERVHILGEDLTQDYHDYEMIWSATSIQILFDGELLHTYEANSNNNIDRFLNKNQRVVLNTAVGGDFFTDNISSNYADSAAMDVDWVRVFMR